MNQSFGRKPNQAPINQFLGKLAFIDTVTPVAESITSAYTISQKDNGKILVISGTTTITLPAAIDIYGKEPFMIWIKAITGATVSVARTGSDTIETVAANKSMAANTALGFFPTSLTGWETI